MTGVRSEMLQFIIQQKQCLGRVPGTEPPGLGSWNAKAPNSSNARTTKTLPVLELTISRLRLRDQFAQDTAASFVSRRIAFAG